MTLRLTRLNLTGLALVAWALWLGVLSGRAELLLATVPLLIGLVRAGLGTGVPRYTLTHAVSATRVFEGDRLRVTVTLTAESPLPTVELIEPLPAAVRLASGGHRLVAAVAAGETIRWGYELLVPTRAVVTLGTLHLRVSERSGLRAFEAVYRDPKVIRVYPRPAPLRRLPAPVWTQTSVGHAVSTVTGDGLEPGEVRPFAPGDRVRHVNWRASLRRRRLHVTRYQEERNADVVLMLDTLGDAGRGAATTVNACVRAAASLARGYLERRDRVGLVEYGGVFRWLKPGTGRVQLERLLDTLLRAEVTFTYVTRELALVPPRILPPRAVVIALSPLLDPRFVTAARDLAGRGFDLRLLAVDPVPFACASLPFSLLTETAGRLWALERQIQLAELRRQGLRVVSWDPREPLDVALAGLERHRRRRRTG